MIFRGAGALVLPLMWLGGLIGILGAAGGVDWLMTVGMMVSAVLMFAIGRYLNAGDPFGNTFFFVPLEYWALFPAAAVIVTAVRAMFV